MFRRVVSKPSFPDIESAVLLRWKNENIFRRSIQQRKGCTEFVVYDGPPFPTGSPHHGTLFVSVLKDVVCRYKTMRGYYVPRAWGWDCHGLPIETQAEKNLGITNKGEIEGRIGVAAFNDECRKIVTNHSAAWKVYIDKIGRWVEFDQPYNTSDCSFMESVIWAFAEAHRKGLIYKDYRVTPYCFRCETPLSISDTRLDDATRSRQDRAITVRFRSLVDPNTYFLAWTTTPWTLPANLALAVGAKIPYATVRLGHERYVLAEACLSRYQSELQGFEVERVQLGTEIAAQRTEYQPLFPYVDSHRSEGAFRIIEADFVAIEDGTGIVHVAPAFGEDDYWACRREQIPIFAPVDDRGCYSEVVTDFAGQHVLEANSGIIKFLKLHAMVVRDETIEHNYPHCWRCRNPLLYRAVNAWYFNVDKVKPHLLATNEEIAWYPATVKHGRFGKWLENARDWNISRNRFWATPIPVWECGNCQHWEVLGSIAEIQSKADFEVTDLHKEFLDRITYSCSCGGIMHRTAEVLDGWFESGSMPYGQYHYPFENGEHFRSHFPADFICEYTGQIRGWFYMLYVLSTALFDRPAFKHCLVHGTLLAADGKKISKSQKNYTDPLELISRYGADALRTYLLSSAAVSLSDLWFRDEGVDGMLKSIMLPLWNALNFFATYAEIDEISYQDVTELRCVSGELDRFILAECEALVGDVTAAMDQYDIQSAMRHFHEFLDALNNWYIRRSRERVWAADKREPGKLDFYHTLFHVLSTITRLIAPAAPFTSEQVWTELGHQQSVHLADWPEQSSLNMDLGLRDEINCVRKVVSAGFAIRAREKIRVRQPLLRARVCVTSGMDLERYRDLIAEELNVKVLEFVPDPEEVARRFAKANSKVVGPKLGKKTQAVIEALKRGDFVVSSDGGVEVLGERLGIGDFEFTYVGLDGLLVQSIDCAVVALDADMTPELLLEGYARDLVRYIQEARKDAGLRITDRIVLSVSGADDVLASFGEHIIRETLGLRFESGLIAPKYQGEVDLGGRKIMQGFSVA